MKSYKIEYRDPRPTPVADVRHWQEYPADVDLDTEEIARAAWDQAVAVDAAPIELRLICIEVIATLVRP